MSLPAPSSYLTQVFSIHRFAALGTAIPSILAPTVLRVGQSTKATTEALFLTQLWGAFVLGVSGIAHVSTKFMEKDQVEVAKAFTVLFGVSTVVAVRGSFHATDAAAARVLSGVAALFFGLFSAYGYGVYLGSQDKGKKL